MLVVEFADLKIGSAAERYRTSMAKYLPKPLRTLYRGGRARAVNGFTSSNAAIKERSVIAPYVYPGHDLPQIKTATFLNFVLIPHSADPNQRSTINR